ncbi:hypothetical protein [Streptomyces sp. NPDC049590]|uniref:hypothetical protein n=1 Tax=Streptomyces sp. NPDC049590 TaxID=3154834 RepID=UPI003425DDCA
MSKPLRTAGVVVGMYALLVLGIRFAGGGVGWGPALLIALVLTPLALWLTWLRRRMRERAREWGQRRFRPWPEERHR